MVLLVSVVFGNEDNSKRMIETCTTSFQHNPKSLGETFLMTLFSLVLSLALTPWLLSVFKDFVPKNLHFGWRQDPGVFVFLPLLLIVVTLLAGLYPAFVLSRF